MTVPDQFKHVVIDGALYHTYMFRDNSQQAAITKQKFEEGIDRMRTLLINRFTSVGKTIFVSRKDKTAIKDQMILIEKSLKDNYSVILFPEGTSSDGLNVLPFKSSLFIKDISFFGSVELIRFPSKE